MSIGQSDVIGPGLVEQFEKAGVDNTKVVANGDIGGVRAYPCSA